MSSLAQTTSQPAQLLRDELTRRSGKNPAYSLRAFARDLGVSHTYLSLVMNGKKELSLRQAFQMSSVLGLEQEPMPSLVTPLALPVPKKVRQSLKKKAVELENDRFQFISQWYHIAILDLTLVKGFQSDIEWIAKTLAITPKQAGRAVSRLERLGLLKLEKGAWVKTSEEIFVPGSIPVAAIRRFHEQMIQKAIKSLRSKKPGAFQTRDITGTTMAVDPTRLAQAQKKIQRFRKDLMRFLSQGERTALYQLNVQLFEIGGNE